MARLIRPLRRTLFCSAFPFNVTCKQNPPSFQIQSTSSMLTHRRNYLSELRQSTFKDHMLRLLRNEIRYELDQSLPKIPVTKFYSYSIDDRPGEQWISLKMKFADNEEVKIEATMFDGEVPIPKSSGGGPKDEVELHITCIVNISRGGGDVLEIMCSAWPDSIEVTKLFVRSSGAMPVKPYDGPGVKELDQRLEEALYDFLEARGINDDMAVFLHEYMKNKEKTEYLRWMGTVKSHIEQK